MYWCGTRNFHPRTRIICQKRGSSEFPCHTPIHHDGYFFSFLHKELDFNLLIKNSRAPTYFPDAKTSVKDAKTVCTLTLNRNRPINFLTNVFTALKGTHFGIFISCIGLFLFEFEISIFVDKNFVAPFNNVIHVCHDVSSIFNFT